MTALNVCHRYTSFFAPLWFGAKRVPLAHSARGTAEVIWRSSTLRKKVLDLAAASTGIIVDGSSTGENRNTRRERGVCIR